MARLHKAILEFFDQELTEAWLLVPYDRPQLRGQIFANAQVLGEEYDDAGTRFRVRIDKVALKQLAREVQVITGQKE